MSIPSNTPDTQGAEDPTGGALDLRGPKILIEGPTGTGKTHSIGTLVDWAEPYGVQVYVMFTENSAETLFGYWRDKGKPIPENLHVCDMLVRPISLKGLIDASDKVGKLTYESITKLVDPNRSGDNNAYWKILKGCADFVDSRTGEHFGALDSWPTESIFVMDSLSELSNAAMKMVIGNKPTASQPDYGVAQNNLMNFLRLLTQGVRCGVVMTAHVERQVEEISGQTKITTKAVGKALANEIPQLFSDIIYTYRDGAAWYWDTANILVDLKTRNLPVQSKLPPNFAPLMQKWASRAGLQLKKGA